MGDRRAQSWLVSGSNGVDLHKDSRCSEKGVCEELVTDAEPRVDPAKEGVELGSRRFGFSRIGFEALCWVADAGVSGGSG